MSRVYGVQGGVASILTKVLISRRALASMASHLCWYCVFTSGSLEVSEFFTCRPAATRATCVFPGLANTLDSSTRNVGYNKRKVERITVGYELRGVGEV